MTTELAPAFDFDELPDPPDKDELLDKTERVRRLALHLPDPIPAELEEAPITACPICGCDVTGCRLSVGDDGRRRWTQLPGGLVHIEGGRRCLADVEEPRR